MRFVLLRHASSLRLCRIIFAPQRTHIMRSTRAEKHNDGSGSRRRKKGSGVSDLGGATHDGFECRDMPVQSWPVSAEALRRSASWPRQCAGADTDSCTSPAECRTHASASGLHSRFHDHTALMLGVGRNACRRSAVLSILGGTGIPLKDRRRQPHTVTLVATPLLKLLRLRLCRPTTHAIRPPTASEYWARPQLHCVRPQLHQSPRSALSV
jgi:hypothetical protein